MLSQKSGVATCQQRRAFSAAPVRRCAALSRRLTVAARAERSSSDGFLAGFVVGGVVFGALGFLFAPQIARSVLGDDQRLKLPRFLEEEGAKDPEATKQDLVDKIAQLNASIDEVAAQLRSNEKSGAPVEESAMSLS